jgi:hypothetical protein
MKRKERDGEAPHDAEEATSAKKDSEVRASLQCRAFIFFPHNLILLIWLASCSSTSKLSHNNNNNNKHTQPEAGQAKRLKEGGAAAAQQLHESVLRELSRLDAQKNALSAGASSSASTEEATTSSSSSSSASSSSSVQLAPAFLELNSFALPSDLFESEAWDLREVELRNWWAPSTRGGRPAVEIGSAKRRSSDTYVYLALPTDTANPSHPGTVMHSLAQC